MTGDRCLGYTESRVQVHCGGHETWPEMDATQARMDVALRFRGPPNWRGEAGGLRCRTCARSGEVLTGLLDTHTLGKNGRGERGREPMTTESAWVRE